MCSVSGNGGRETGLIYERDARYPLEVRLPERMRIDPQALARLPIAWPNGRYVALSEVASITSVEGPNQFSRDNGKRRIVVAAGFSSSISRCLAQLNAAERCVKSCFALRNHDPDRGIC